MIDIERLLRSNPADVRFESIIQLAMIPEIDPNLIDRFWDWFNRPVHTLTNTLTVTEAAEMYGKSRSTIYRWIKSGKLQAEKVNRRWYINPTS